MGIFSANKNKLVLVLDIGSSSTGGALLWVPKSGIPKIIMAIREPIVLQKTLDVNKFLASTIKSLQVVVGKIYKAGMGKPEEIFCVLSSPWHVSQTRVIRLEKNTPFIFTAKLADSLIQKEIDLFEEEHTAKYESAKIPVRSIELKNIKTILNGYESPKPLNQKVKEVEMTIFIGMSPEQVLKKIEETISKCFHFKNIKFSSSTLASFAVVRDMHAHNENFLLIDIGGEVTDISMAKKNILRESVSFPLGLNFMTRGVASALHIPLSEAKSLMSLFRDGYAAPSAIKKIEPVMDKIKTEWLKNFQESLAHISNDISVPSTIYLAVDKDSSSFFSEIIKNEQFNQYTLTESKFEIISLDMEAFQGMIEFGINVTRDFGLVVDSIYISRFLNNPVLGEKV